MQRKTIHRAACSCGRVELATSGAPIVASVCYCDDCLSGARQIEALPGAAPVADADGGTSYLLFRKDRFTCVRGGDLLDPVKLTAGSASSRMVARCCNTGMYLGFDDSRHWVSAYRARFIGALPPVAMRMCTKFRRSDMPLPADAPASASYSPRLIAKLVGARLAMLFGS